MMSMKLT